MAKINSRAKGQRGERAICKILVARGYTRAKRGIQTRGGGAEVPDVVNGIPGYHLEVKWQETLHMDKWSAQAENDAPEDQVPAVVYRRSRQPWRISLKFDDFLDLLDKANDKN